MGDLAVDTAVEGSDGHYTATHVARLGDLGTERRLRRRDRCAPRARTRASTGPITLVGHFLGVADFDSPVDLEVTTLREAKRAQSVRVSMTQRGQPIFDAMVWSVGDVSGLEHDVSEMPDAPDPRVVAVGRRPARRDSASSRTSGSGETSTNDPRAGSTTGRTARRKPPVAGDWYRYVPRSTFDDPWLDACRSLILLDTLGWPAACRLHTQPRIHRAEHRPLGRVPPVAARRTVALRAGELPERERRPRRLREPRVVPRRNPPRRRRQPTPLPPRPTLLEVMRL